MPADRLDELLRAADAEIGPPAALPRGLAARVLRLHRRRARTAELARNVAAVLVVTIGASVIIGTLDRLDGRPRPTSMALPPQPATDWEAELAQLRDQANSRAAIARRVAQIERQQERMAALQARLREPDPRQVVRREVDLTATVLVQQADHMYHDLGLPKPAAENYRQVVRLFPNTASAGVARQRLKEMETVKGDS